MARCDDYLEYGFFSIREALEKDYQKSVWPLNGWVPAAAQWIFHAGQVVYESQLEIDRSPTHGDALGGGDLGEGSCKGTWSLWKDRFDWVQKNLEVERQTRQTAGEAFALMASIQGSQ